MATIGDKELQRRAMREAQLVPRPGNPAHRRATPVVEASGDQQRPKFDRNAYQREYMRKRRAKLKAQ